MKKLIFLPSMRLWLGVSLFGYFISYGILIESRCAIAQPILTEVEAKNKNRDIIELSEFASPVTNISGLLSQSPTPTNPPFRPSFARGETGRCHNYGCESQSYRQGCGDNFRDKPRR